MKITTINIGIRPGALARNLRLTTGTIKLSPVIRISLILLGVCMMSLILAKPVAAQGSPSQVWHLDGNRRTDPNTDFIGTTDSTNLVIRTSNQPRIIVDASGRTRALFAMTVGDSLDVAGIGRFNNTTDSSSPTNGAVVVAGGLGVGKNLNVGQDLIVVRDANIGRSASIGGPLSLLDPTASTSPTTGALIVAGGAGIGKSLNVRLDANVGQDVNITRDLNVGTNANVTGLTRLNNTTASTSATNGALVVSGGVGIGGKLNVAGDTTTHALTANVVTVLGGSDLAEPFKVNRADAVKPGMVVSIDPARRGELRISDCAYDRTVAGVISGANGIRAGLTMQQSGSVADGEFPVALSGRVWVYADADTNGSIRPGDLLTTSPVPGHAMKVTDYTRGQGATLGKAMSSLDKGRGFVLLLVLAQ